MILSQCTYREYDDIVSKDSSIDSVKYWLEKYTGASDIGPGGLLYLKESLKHTDRIRIDTIRKEFLLEITDHFLQSLSDSMFRIANSRLYEYAINKPDSSVLAEYYWNRGIFFSESEVLDSAFYSFSKAENTYDRIGDQYKKARMQYNSAYVLRRSKNFLKSEVYAIKAAREFERLKNKEKLYMVYNHLGLVNNDLLKYDLAIEYHNKAKNIIPSFEDPWIYKERSLNNLSLVYQKKGDYDKAIALLDEALLNEQLEKENRNLYSKIIDNRAYNKFLRGDEDSVLEEFQQALGIRRDMENEAGEAISHLHLTEYFLQKKDTFRAFGHVKRAYELAKRNGFNRDVLASLALLSQTDPIRAKSYMKEYITLNDSLLSEERKVRDKFARIELETEGYIAENRELQKRNVWILLLSTFMISTLLFFFLMHRQRAKNRRLILEREQQEANEQIYNLMLKQQNKMEEGRVQERVRISEELHDGVLARLFGIRMGLGFLKMEGDETIRTKYEDYLEEMQGAEQEIRTLSHALKNDELSSKKDFPLLLNDLLVEQARLGGFNHRFIQEPDIAWDRIPDRIKINLYRISQEALHNIIKYAGCGKVEISIRQTGGYTFLEIRDDGIGFNVKKKHRGIGLKNMESRAKQIGGRLEIQSEPGLGTRIQISIQTKHIYDGRKVQSADR